MREKLPQTLLFGNGLNYKIGQSWDELLEDLKHNHTINNDTLPNTMIYEQILLRRLEYEKFDYINKQNNLSNEEFNIKEEVSAYMQHLDIPNIYHDIINLNFANYLTTNYDNIFIKAYQQSYRNKVIIKDLSTETLYSIRRYKQLNNNSRLWHIHGEINQPKSIMLGMDHYIGSVSKIDDYIKGNYKFSNKKVKYSMEDKIKRNSFDYISWIELFFNSDVHILGFGLDYSEIDLWSILNKRSRLMHKVNINNKIFFYEKKLSCINCKNIPENVKKYEEKMELLKSFNVIVVELDCDYNKLYQNAIQKIKNNQDILN